MDDSGGSLGLDRCDCSAAFFLRTTTHVYSCIIEREEADALVAYPCVASCHEVDFPAEVGERGWIKAGHSWDELVQFCIHKAGRSVMSMRLTTLSDGVGVVLDS